MSGKIANQPRVAPKPIENKTTEQHQATTSAQQTQQTQATQGPTWIPKSKSTPAPQATTAKSQREMEIVCPVLGAMVAEGKIKLQPDGTMSFKDLRELTKEMGLSGPLRAGLIASGYIANEPRSVLHNMVKDEMNALDLRTGLIKHPGDSAILTGGAFDEAKFQALVSHAENGRMTVDSFGKAIADNVQRDLKPGQKMDTLVRGKNFSLVEFSGLMAVFGTKDPKTGKVGISVEDLRALYQDKKLPPSNRATMVELTALQASMTLKADAALAGAGIRSLATATGLSEAGAKLTEGSAATAAGQASVGAGKAANCPYMNGAVKMPNSPNDVVNAHTQAGMQAE